MEFIYCAEQAGAGQADRLCIGYSFEDELIAFDVHIDDGAIDGAGAARYIYTFESRTGGRGGCQNRFAIGDQLPRINRG